MLDTIREPETNHLPPFLSGDVTSETISEPAAQPTVQQCFHQITAGHRCNAPALRGEYYCRHHFKRAPLVAPSNTPFDLPVVTDRESTRAALLEIATRVAANSLDVRRAGVIIYSLYAVLSTFPRLARLRPEAPPKADAPAPTDPAAVAARVRMFFERAQSRRTSTPDPFDLPHKTNQPDQPAGRLMHARAVARAWLGTRSL